MSSPHEVLLTARAAGKPPRPWLPLQIILRLANRWALVIVLCALWEIGVRAGWINGNAFPAPTVILKTVTDQAMAGALWANVCISVSRVFIGVSAASLLGVGLGSLLARFERAEFYCAPLLELLRPISVIAWIPVAIIWFGLGDESSWFIIGLGAFFPVFTSSYLGMKLVPAVYLQAARTLGLGHRQIFACVLWPAALPNVLAGIRVGLGVGWMCVIAAEMISSTSGLGYMIQMARVMIETEQVFAGMIVIGVIGFAMNHLMVMLEKRLTPWAAGQTGK